MTRSTTAPAFMLPIPIKTGRATEDLQGDDKVERLGEEMDRVFALLHGRGMGARARGQTGRRAGSGLRHDVVGGGTGGVRSGDEGDAMDVDP